MLTASNKRQYATSFIRRDAAQAAIFFGDRKIDDSFFGKVLSSVSKSDTSWCGRMHPHVLYLDRNHVEGINIPWTQPCVMNLLNRSCFRFSDPCPMHRLRPHTFTQLCHVQYRSPQIETRVQGERIPSNIMLCWVYFCITPAQHI